MRRVVGLALFVVALLVLARLAQSDFEFPLDSDFRAAEITEWRRFFTALAPLSKPMAYAYFDGQLIVNGLVAALLRALASAFRPLREWLPNDDAYGVAAALIVNVTSYAGACVLLYASLLRAGVTVVIAAAAAVAMLLSPQMLNMSLLRQDFLITLPMMATFYCSVIIVRCEERLRHAIALGLALGVLATVKFNGLMFVLFPAFAVLLRGRAALSWAMVRFVAGALAVFAATYLIMMARYVYFYSFADWLALYPTGINVLTSWKELLAWDFSLFYNVDLVRRHGTEFIALYAACTLVLAVMAVRDRMAAFLVLSLLAYSTYSAFTMKYGRGGYHLIPLFLAVIAYTAALIWHMQRFTALRYAGLAAIAVVMVSSLWRSVQHYQTRVDTMREWSATLGDLWRPALQWLRANVRPTDRICIEIHSEWALPLNSLLRQIKYGPFDHPYTEGKKLSRHEPPDDERLRRECDWLAIESGHQRGLQRRRQRVDPANAERWAAYFRELPDRFERVHFQTARKQWLVQWIEFYRIR